jgi:hypothetical protein
VKSHIFILHERDDDSKSYMELFSKSGQLEVFVTRNVDDGKETASMIEIDRQGKSSKDQTGTMAEIELQKKRMEEANDR